MTPLVSNLKKKIIQFTNEIMLEVNAQVIKK